MIPQVAVLEKRMETMNERYDKGWQLLEASMRKASAKHDLEFAKLREDIAKRDIANTRWLIGMITAATVIIIAVMAVLLPIA